MLSKETLRRSLTCGGHGEVEERVVLSRKEGEQHLGLAVGDARSQPCVELTDVGLQGDCPEPAVDAQGVGAQRRGHVAQHYPHRDGNPGGVWVHLVVFHLGQYVDVLVPQR